ncbi:MAG: hypothetical protein ACTSPI_00440 [Candidatus Heimdallarchaeaceae archaeon]
MKKKMGVVADAKIDQGYDECAPGKKVKPFVFYLVVSLIRTLRFKICKHDWKQTYFDCEGYFEVTCQKCGASFSGRF